MLSLSFNSKVNSHSLWSCLSKSSLSDSTLLNFTFKSLRPYYLWSISLPYLRVSFFKSSSYCCRCVFYSVYLSRTSWSSSLSASIILIAWSFLATSDWSCWYSTNSLSNSFLVTVVLSWLNCYLSWRSFTFSCSSFFLCSNILICPTIKRLSSNTSLFFS